MSHLKQWLRSGRQNPGRFGFLVLSLSIALGGALAATALHAAVSWRNLVSFLANVTAILAIVAIVLAAAGLQALTLYWVYAARRELGIRRAMGASHRNVLTWFGRRWGVVVAPAVAAGIAIQFALMRMTASQVEAVQPASLAHLLVGIVVVVAYASGAAGTALMRALRNDEKVLLQ